MPMLAKLLVGRETCKAPVNLDSQSLVFSQSCKAQVRLMWRAAVDATIRPVVIVLVQVATDAFSSLHETTIFRRPDFLFLQAAVEPFGGSILAVSCPS